MSRIWSALFHDTYRDFAKIPDDTSSEFHDWAYYSTWNTLVLYFVIEFTLMSHVDGLRWLITLKIANLLNTTKARAID